MSVIELKERMHQQIDLLTDEQDIEDLYANLNFFFQSREMHFDNNSPSFLEKLNDGLKQDPKDGINSEQLRQKIREWLIK